MRCSSRRTRARERDAVLAALDAETPPPAPELAWLFRQFCEASARERPLVLVFDDVHWAEPTFLELVEHLADKGTGPISVVCLAREELLEDRAAFLEGRANADRIVLDALSGEETDALLEGLGGDGARVGSARPHRRDRGGEPALPRAAPRARAGGWPRRARRCRRRSRRCSPRASTGSAPASARCSSVGRSSGRSSRRTTSSRCSIPTPRRRPTRTCRRSPAAASCGRAATARSASATSSCRRRSTASAPKRLRAELHERFADRLDTESPELSGARRVRRLPPRAGVPAADGARRVGSADGAACRGRRAAAGRRRASAR